MTTAPPPPSGRPWSRQPSTRPTPAPFFSGGLPFSVSPCLFRFRLERDPEAAAVVSRSTRPRHLEDEIRQLPPLAPRPHAIRLQQIVGRPMIAMLVLDPPENRELVAGTAVHLEIEPRLVVNPFGELSGPLIGARLPVAFEQ